MAACSPYEAVEEGMGPAYNLHSISVISGHAKYNIATYSHINRTSTTDLQADQAHWTLVEKGTYRGWSWDFEAESSAAQDVIPFTRPTVQVQTLKDGRHLDLPSLTQMMQRLHDLAIAEIGDDLPPLELKFTFIPVSLNAKYYVEHHSDDAVILDYYLPAPDPSEDPSTRAIDWMSFDTRLAAHEYLHALIETGRTPRLPNEFTEEVTAYTFETCAQLYVMGPASGMRFVDASDKTMDPEAATSMGAAEGFMKSSAGVSDDGRVFAMYDIVHVLGKNVIEPGDDMTRSMLFGLCRAMVHDPVDLTRGFYPSASVQPLPL